MIIKFSITDRIVALANLIPESGDISRMSTVRALKHKLEISEEESTAINLRREGTSYLWDKDKEFQKVIELTLPEASILNEQIDELDSSKGVTLQMLDTIEKIKKG